MTLWMILTIMIAAAAVLISAPFIRRFERTRLASAEYLAVYRDQLTEIKREAGQGLIDTAQAESASVEIKRRIIAADRIAEGSGRPFTRSERNFAVTAITAIVIFGSIALYAVIGSPDLPSASPLQAGNEPAAAPGMPRSATSTLGTARPGAAAESRDPAQPQSGLPPVEEMIQRVQTRLERSPKDADGWRLLGWSFFNIERFADAAQAYSRAIELRPESAEYRSARGEALVRAADGTVTPEARKDFDETLRLDPKDARARFFVGMAKEQDGNKEGAIADWSAIVAGTDPNEPWLPDLKQRLAALQRGGGGDGGGAVTPARPGLTAQSMQGLLRADKMPEAPTERGPTAEDVRRADAMSQPDRKAMIRSMVDGLATRLEQSPRDAEGWIKLIRSRAVLGEADLAKQSLQRALSVFAEDGGERTRIADAAKQLGIEP